MIENQAYIVALLLLIASPIAIASDEGQAVLERFEKTPDDLIDIEKNDRTEALDNLLEDDIRDVVEDCYTIEQWKERLADYDWNKKDWEQESDEVREDDGARGNSDDKKEKEDYNKETDKVTDKDCFTEAEFEEFVGTMGNDERKGKEDCVTVGQVREKWERIREGARDRDYDRDWDRDDDEDDDEREESDEDEGARGENEEESDEGNDLDNEVDEEKAELVAVIGELKEACEDGDEAACLELEELLKEYWNDWEQDKKERDWVREDRDDSECVGKHMMDRMKEKFGRDRGEKDRDRNHDHDWERDDDEEWEEFRAFMAELGVACDEGDEEACEELEELIIELENDAWERDEDCDEHDEHDEDDENDHDEDDEDDSEDEEDDSGDDEPENA